MSIPSIVTSATGTPRLLLVCSIGNPAHFRNSFHSAGHHLLDALQVHLSYPPLRTSAAHAKGFVSRGEDAHLWKSPTLMNLSGPAVASAWRAFLKEIQSSDDGGAAKERARLVVLHDELELELGKVKVRKPGGSMKGHNGLKSIASLGSAVGGRDGWWRIGIGIGRPDSREQGDVSNYVLRQMERSELETIHGAVEEVVEELVTLRAE